MTIMLDELPLNAELGPQSTLGDALDFITQQIQNTGKIIVRVALDGASLEGAAITDNQTVPITDRRVDVATAAQADLSRAMIGKLAALTTFLGGRQHEIAGLIEQGQPAKALAQLGDLLSAWSQIQQAFGSLTVLMKIDLKRQFVGNRTGEECLQEFHAQLNEIRQALEKQDMVLLGDILQYEMDSAVANWNDLLATLLGIVDGVVEIAA